MLAATAVTGGPGLGSCTMRANVDARHRIDTRDRSTTGTDLHHFDHGDANRHSTAFEEPVLPRHFKRARKMRLPVIDKAYRCGRPGKRYRARCAQRRRRGHQAPAKSGWRGELPSWYRQAELVERRSIRRKCFLAARLNQLWQRDCPSSRTSGACERRCHFFARANKPD